MEFKLSFSLLLNGGVEIKEGKTTEVSLDCHICQRTDRTIIFERNKTPICMKTGHEIGGSLAPGTKTFSASTSHGGLDNNAKKVTIVYPVTFDYQPFTDQKSGIPASPTAHWGRVYFSLKCPVCHAATKFSTQSNVARPAEFHCEKCGHLLALDTEEQPTYRYIS